MLAQLYAASAPHRPRGQQALMLRRAAEWLAQAGEEGREPQATGDGAIGMWEEIVRLEPADDEARSRLEALYVKAGRFRDAVRLNEQSLARDPAPDDYSKGLILERIVSLYADTLDQPERAIPYVEQILSVDPEAPGGASRCREAPLDQGPRGARGGGARAGLRDGRAARGRTLSFDRAGERARVAAHAAARAPRKAEGGGARGRRRRAGSLRPGACARSGQRRGSRRLRRRRHPAGMPCRRGEGARARARGREGTLDRPPGERGAWRSPSRPAKCQARQDGSRGGALVAVGAARRPAPSGAGAPNDLRGDLRQAGPVRRPRLHRAPRGRRRQAPGGEPASGRGGAQAQRSPARSRRTNASCRVERGPRRSRRCRSSTEGATSARSTRGFSTRRRTRPTTTSRPAR